MPAILAGQSTGGGRFRQMALSTLAIISLVVAEDGSRPFRRHRGKSSSRVNVSSALLPNTSLCLTSTVVDLFALSCSRRTAFSNPPSAPQGVVGKLSRLTAHA